MRGREAVPADSKRFREPFDRFELTYFSSWAGCKLLEGGTAFSVWLGGLRAERLVRQLGQLAKVRRRRRERLVRTQLMSGLRKM